MRPSTRRLISVAVGALLFWIVGAILALIFQWPTQLDGSGRPTIGLQEFILQGTATSAPVTIMILLTLLIVLSRSRRWWGIFGVVGLCLVSIVTFIGGLGEVFAPPSPFVPTVVLVASGVLSCIISVILLVVGIAEVIDRVRIRRRAVVT